MVIGIEAVPERSSHIGWNGVGGGLAFTELPSGKLEKVPSGENAHGMKRASLSIDSH